MLTEEKFFKKAQDFALYPTVDGDYFTFNELKEELKNLQTDKEDNLIVLYASDKDQQHTYIETAKNKGYKVLLLDSPIIPHLIQKLETENEKVKFARVDADIIDNLIKKDDTKISKLSEDEISKLETSIKKFVPTETYTVQLEPLDSSENPFIITQPEFMRRYKEMSQTGGGGIMGLGDLPDAYNLIVNTNHPLMDKILKAKKNKEKYINQALDLAKLTQNLLTGKDMTDFVKRSFEILGS
jgi:molecular chaperone HtpG